MLIEVRLVLVVLGMAFSWAVPEVLRIYKYAAVRYEAEHLMSELRYQQMVARTAAQEMAGDGSTAEALTRPRLRMTGKGYLIYRGQEPVRRYSCLAPVKMQFYGSTSGSMQILNFYANGNVLPNTSIKIFAPGGVSCRLVIDAAGRFRLERSENGG